MTPLVDYWLKANLYLLLFYGCYALLLRRHTFLVLNRVYLMGSLVLALVLPLVHIPGLAFPWPWESDRPEYTAVSVDAITVVGTATETQAPLLPDWPVLAVWVFALVAVGLLIRTVWRTYALLRLVRQWPAQTYADHTLVLPDNSQTPTFSFFRYLVLNPEDLYATAVRQHELVHIRQKHSVDVLLLEILQALCWPNPVLFGYRQAIRQVHEYLADRAVTAQTPAHRDAYARFLVNYAFHLPAGTVMTDQPGHDSLAHSFGPDRPDSPTLKQRIQMLYQQHTRRRALWKYALVLPLATALLAMTNKPEIPVLDSNVGLALEMPHEGSSASTDRQLLVHVTGVVRDQSGKPLPGANVVVRNGHKGTSTDAEGRFSIDVPGGTVLVASFVGFEAQEMRVMEKEFVMMSFSLEPQTVTLSNSEAQMPKSTTEPTASRGGTKEVFMVVEQAPTYPGGMAKLFDFLSKNIRYPEEARQKKIQGKVFVNFVVNTDGAIDQIRVLKGLGAGCDEEAIRVVARMPDWTPGRQNGKPVAVQYNLPITFTMSNKVGSTSSTSPKSSTYFTKDTVIIQHIGTGRSYSPNKIPNSKNEDPLFFLDGEEITKEQMEAIDTKTIQSVDVLKDAAATSVYGEKGRHGVVQITTKKGSQSEKKKDR